MVPLQILGRSFILIVVASCIIQGHEYSEDIDAQGAKEEDILNNSPDSAVDDFYNVERSKRQSNCLKTVPDEDDNTDVNCEQINMKRGTCILSCKKNSTFPDDSTTITIECNNGNWKVTSGTWKEISKCQERTTTSTTAGTTASTTISTTISTTTSTTTSTIIPPPDKCVNGWSKWINEHKPQEGTTKYLECERLPDWKDLINTEGFGICNKEHIVDITCRPVAHKSLCERGYKRNVNPIGKCSLECGWECESYEPFICVDYEISVLCCCPDHQSITHSKNGTIEISREASVPLKDVCLYTYNEDQGKPRVAAKKIGEKWNDGKCKICICENSIDGPRTNCSSMECLSIDAHPDVNNYVLKKVELNDKCCPIYERTACKWKGKIYNVGENWKPNAKNACLTMHCSKDSGSIQLLNEVQDIACDYQPLNINQAEACKTVLMDANSTIGMLVVNHPLHGKCKNVNAIKGIKQCSGSCQSSTFLNSENENQVSDRQCCQVKEYMNIKVILKCEDGETLRKKLPIPRSCSCQSCA